MNGDGADEAADLIGAKRVPAAALAPDQSLGRLLRAVGQVVGAGERAGVAGRCRHRCQRGRRRALVRLCVVSDVWYGAWCAVRGVAWCMAWCVVRGVWRGVVRGAWRDA